MPDNQEEKNIKVPRFEKRYGFSTSLERSLLMSKIKGKNTSPELLLRKALWQIGLRYRLHNKKLPGNPDVVMKKFNVVIFIDGEFWHGYNWSEKKLKIKANRDFWIPKIERNMQRDRQNNMKLEGMGFRVFRFWEHEIKRNLADALSQITNYIDTASKST